MATEKIFKYSDKDYQQLCFYINKVVEKRVDYFECIDAYYNFQFSLCDKYSIKELDDIIHTDYVSWERLKMLYHNMLIALSEYEKALRELYNFKVMLRFDNREQVVIVDLREGKESTYLLGKRQYKGVK